MKSRCCRATPRCAGCPVLLAAARRRQEGVPDLFAEILGGRSGRALPESVVRALEQLDARPRGGRFTPASEIEREPVLAREPLP
jgi:hypothetical protein